MMDFGKPLFLFLAVPWAAMAVIFFLRQRASLRFIADRAAPRFVDRFTTYRPFMLPIHAVVLFIMGMLLICAAAHPGRSGTVDAKVKADTLIFVIDGSLSMVAIDNSSKLGLHKDASRKDAATAIALEIMKRFPDYKFGLITFSGIAAYHSPPTIDHEAMRNYLKSLRLHMFEKTGSDFKAALGAVIHLSERSPRSGFQVVLLSDGEEKQGQDYSDELKILKKRKIPVHSVGIGSTSGGDIYIYDPQDLLAGKQKPNVITTTRTYRVDEHLKKISAATGGMFIVLESGEKLNDLYRTIKYSPGQPSLIKKPGREDMSYIFIIAFAVLFLADVLVFDGIVFWKDIVRAIRRRRERGV